PRRQKSAEQYQLRAPDTPVRRPQRALRPPYGSSRSAARNSVPATPSTHAVPLGVRYAPPSRPDSRPTTSGIRPPWLHTTVTPPPPASCRIPFAAAAASADS